MTNYSHGYPYIIGTAVNDHVAAYMAHGGLNWGTVGNDDHWAPGHNGDHTSKPGDPTRPQPYITANDSWTGGTYDHDDYAFNFLLPRLQAGFYKRQIKFFNCSHQQWSSNNGWIKVQDSSGDDHLHVSFYGTGMFRFTGTADYFVWKGDGRPNPKTWRDGAISNEDSLVGACVVNGQTVVMVIGTDNFPYLSLDDGVTFKRVSTAAKYDAGISVTPYKEGVLAAVRALGEDVVMLNIPNLVNPSEGYRTMKLNGTGAATPAIVVKSDGVVMIAVKGNDAKGPNIYVRTIMPNGKVTDWVKRNGRAL